MVAFDTIFMEKAKVTSIYKSVDTSSCETLSQNKESCFHVVNCNHARKYALQGYCLKCSLRRYVLHSPFSKLTAH